MRFGRSRGSLADMSDLSPSLLRNLANLRWLAIASQTLTIAIAPRLLGYGLATSPLWAGVATLAVFNLWAMRRARDAARITAAEAVLHLAVDIVVLAWLIGGSGGAMNPFAPLFLLPIVLSAVALPVRWVVATALLAGAGYAASALLGTPLPHAHGDGADVFNLHLIGMAVMFVLSAAVLTFFLTRLARALRTSERALSVLREQFARSEGILALATHAAAVAHELNTPLATLTLMLEDQVIDLPQGSPAHTDARTMAALVDVCRDRVRELAAPADPAQGTATTSIGRVVERWQLLRPGIALERSGQTDVLADLPIDAGVGHLLMALLNNAADASRQASDERVVLHVCRHAGMLSGYVRDYGEGLDDAAFAPAALFRSTKSGGLGVGLALSHATVERLGGALTLRKAPDGGSCVDFRLPWGDSAAVDA